MTTSAQLNLKSSVSRTVSSTRPIGQSSNSAISPSRLTGVKSAGSSRSKT